MFTIDATDLPLESVYRWEKERPNSIYMTQPVGNGQVKDYTWAQTIDEARRMARHLQSLGHPPGSKIAILSKNCAHFVLSDLAIWMAGYVSVALYPTSAPDTIQYILEHSESKLVFVGKLDAFDAKTTIPEGMDCIAYPLAPKTDYTTWDEIIKKTEPIEGRPVRDIEDTSLLIYTSGSTGKPKGVEHTFRSIVAGPKGAIIDIFKLTSQDRFISYLPLAHVFERAAIEIASFQIGNHVFFAESLETFVADLNRARPTFFHSVPRLWLKFQQGVLAKRPQKQLDLLFKIPIISGIVKKKILAKLGLDSAKYAVSGSAPIPPQLIDWYRNLGLELLEGYAMTEDFVCSHVSLPGKSRVGYVGNTVPGAEVRISPEGEVQLKTLGCMKCYFKEPELTKESFTEDGYFKTGDRGELDEAGRLKITGRVKELFKTSKGKYISPAPIENMLNANEAVELSCVTGAGFAQPFAFVMLNETLRKQLAKGTADKGAIVAGLTQLLKQINGQVEEWEKLSSIVIARDEWAIDNGFLTPTMKLKRAAVDDNYGADMARWAESKEKVVWH